MPAPTRRSSRPRSEAAPTAASAAPEANTPIADAPQSRRAVRQRITVAEAVALAAALTADTGPAASATTPQPRPGDPFLRASLTFGTTPIADDSASATEPASSAQGASFERQPSSETADDAPVSSHVAPRRGRKILALGASVGVMGVAGLLAVSMTLPAEALVGASGQSVASTSLIAPSSPAEAADDEIQAFVTSSDVQNESVARSEGFSTVSLVEVASEQGIKFSDSVFSNDPDAAIQWPFMVGVGMSSGYGPRWGTMHQGIDFVPGEGAPIQAIADGTVRIATEQGGGYGVTVYIDHVIDGQVVTSHYAHMQYGSLKVAAGDTVKVGDIVGNTGNTGHSFGAHLHFEIIINGSTIDPLPWLRANAGRDSLG